MIVPEILRDPRHPEEWRPRIFEPYARRDTQTARGSGIGLYAAKRLGESMGARLWCEPAEPTGAGPNVATRPHTFRSPAPGTVREELGNDQGAEVRIAEQVALPHPAWLLPHTPDPFQPIGAGPAGSPPVAAGDHVERPTDTHRERHPELVEDLREEAAWHFKDEYIETTDEEYVEAMRTAATEGKGAVSLDGRLIDAASIRMAENLLAKLEQIEARQTLDVVKPAATA